VPGAFELPLAAKKLAATGKYDALIAIGCVLRGETTHYDYVCSETARGLQLAQMDSGLPIIFCVLTCDTLEQAIDRAGLKGGNKGLKRGSQPSRWRNCRASFASRRQTRHLLESHGASKRVSPNKIARICDADAVPVGHESAGFLQAGSEVLEKRQGGGQNALVREQNFLKARRKMSRRSTQSSSSTPIIGVLNGSRPSIAPFCGWRFMR